MKLFVANIFPMVCASFAMVLIFNHYPPTDWGWFIFLAVISLHVYSNKDK